MNIVKHYQYQALAVEDRGHLTAPSFAAALNEQGFAEGFLACPRCGTNSAPHAKAHGWKHKEEQPMGASRLAVLFEREIEIDLDLCPDVLDKFGKRTDKP